MARQRRRQRQASGHAAVVLLVASCCLLGVATSFSTSQHQHRASSSAEHQVPTLKCLASSLLSWASAGHHGFGWCTTGRDGDDLDGQGDAQKRLRAKVLSRLSSRPQRALDDAGVLSGIFGSEEQEEEVDQVATVFDGAQASIYMPALSRAAKLGVSGAQQQQQQQQRAGGAGGKGVRDAAGDGSPGSFNQEQCTRMGRITSMAYCASDSIRAWNCTRCLRVPGFSSYEVVFDQQWDLLAYTGYDAAQDAVVVAFRGTDSHSWGNWINNLKTWRANKMYPVEGHPGAMVHAGFYDLWTHSCLQRNLTRLVGEIVQAHPTPRLFLTGHSMGGALGSLAALDLKFVHNFTEVRVWTFGSPRVGNLAWEQLFQEHVVESWRFTHNRDIVPSLPPRMLGFHHVPREAWLVDFAGPAGIVEEKVLICDGSGEDPSCHNSACMLGLCTSVADHLTYLGLEMYRDAMEC